jgi:Zn-dependent protease with chaperone function
MKYVRREVGSSADASSGGGHGGLIREIIKLFAAATCLVALIYFGIGFIVEWTLPLISVQREQRWFATFEAKSPSAKLTEKQHAQREYAATVLAKLSSQPTVPPIPFRLIMLPSREPNAFAIPGGTIAITAGLMDLVGDNEVALAFVLGHELGHFAQRDHLRGIGRAIGRALVWSLIFGGGDPISTNADQLLSLGHSRQQETGADQWGIRLVLAAYGTTEGSDRLFRWLATREGNSTWLQLLSTHPGSTERITALRTYARSISDHQPDRSQD